MKRILPLVALFALTSASEAQMAHGVQPSWTVSGQGRLTVDVPPHVRISPGGRLRLELTSARGDMHELRFDVRMLQSGGEEVVLEGLKANGFLASDVGVAVVIDAPESNRLPSRMSFYDQAGRQRGSWAVPQLVSPAISPSGRFLTYGSREGTEVVDLESLRRRNYPALGLRAVSPAGTLLGTSREQPQRLLEWDTSGHKRSVELEFSPLAIAASSEPNSALALTKSALFGVDLITGSVRELYRVAEGTELRDMRVTSSGVLVGQCTQRAGMSTSAMLHLGSSGMSLGMSNPPQVPHAFIAPAPLDAILWPLSPSTPHSVGNTYGEYQKYSGAPYMHPGIDIFGFAGEPVYAVKAGVVKAILTTSGSYHWRIAIGAPGNGTTTGYLYAHVDLPTIAVNVGDAITQGQYLGGLVDWPVANFTHCHFARLRDTGAQWGGSWLCTDNPQPDMTPQVDGTSPLFEPAVGQEAFAFCDNETSNYQNPGTLSGKVDIIARVSDTIMSNWRCGVQTLRYSIWPEGQPNQPIVNNKLAVRFDMALDTYQGGPVDPFLVSLLYKEDGTCDTDGDYNSRDFYYIVTNSDGDTLFENSDLNEAWDTDALSDGNYVVEVTAWDVAGNSSTSSMVVTTSNGNP